MASKQCKFFLFRDSITFICLKNLSENKVSYLTCILIEGTFPSTNQHPCTFSYFESPSTHMQDALGDVFAQRKMIFDSQIDP